MNIQAIDRRQTVSGDDRHSYEQSSLIITDLEKVLAHPVYTDESIATIRKMASNIEAYLRRVLIEPTAGRLRTLVNRIGVFLRNRLLRDKTPFVCTCGRVLLSRGVCQSCFLRELEVLRLARPEMEEAVRVAPLIGNASKQEQAHIQAYGQKVPVVLRRAVEEALKIWIYEVLGVNVLIWGVETQSKGFRRETLKISLVPVPAKGLSLLARFMANNHKLPRRSVAPWVHVLGADPYLVFPFDVGVFCGDNALQVAILNWD